MDITNQLGALAANYEAATMPVKPNTELLGQDLNLAANAVKGQAHDAAAQKAAAVQAMLPEAAAVPSVGKLADVLMAAGFKATPENMAMLEALITNGIAATKENIGKMYQAMRLTGGDLPSATFMMKQNLPLNTATAAVLADFSAGRQDLAKLLADLGEIVQNLPQSPAKTAIVSLLTNLPTTAAESPAQQAPMPQPANLQANTAQPAPLPTAVPTNAAPEAALQNQPPAQVTQNAQPMPNVPLAADAAANQPNQQTQAPAVPGQQAPVMPAQTAPPTLLDGAVSAPATEVAAEVAARPTTLANTPVQAQPAVAAEPAPTQTIQQNITANFALAPPDVGDFPRLAADLGEAMQAVRHALADLPIAAQAQIAEVLDSIINNLDFLSNLRDVTMLQIPINFHNQREAAELYVFSGKQGKGGKNKNEATSALISLNLRNLGLVESYVSREGQAVTIQFRLAKEGVRALFIENMPKLEQGLSDIGYNLNSVAYREIAEKFKLTETQSALDDAADAPTLYNLDLKG